MMNSGVFFSRNCLLEKDPTFSLPKIVQTNAPSQLMLTLFLVFQALLFNISKPFTVVSQSNIPCETLMVDCFVSSFRINYRNSQPFDDCLLPTAPVLFSVVYVKGLYTIVRQV